VDEGRFLPGTMVAGRYRVIGLLGRGGMGEVYRATDLKLGQAVALKFLPEARSHDVHVQSRFAGEVRLARQVSHPNVCRVYDLGEIDGQPYISMEFVDGEDLRSLLRRIGRLPHDKAIEIARKLCAGLAAAHDRGVLHRDLKPGNIMIDARGQVLITDFGLAQLAGEVRGAEVRSGTPAYMAPEQLAGKEVSPASDIYSLGIVLYEMFTGKHPFSASTLADLIRLQNESAVARPTTIVKDLDPAVEGLILRCLQPEPRHRPGSALAIAAALPGADPLAAALAAGETPSPEMVAAAGEVEGLSVRAAVLLITVTVAALLVCGWLIPQVSLLGRAPLDNPPETLLLRCRDLLQRLGYTGRPADMAYGLSQTVDEFLRYAVRNRVPDLRAHIARGEPPLFRFWYRQSPRLLLATGMFVATVTRSDPPPTDSEMIYMEMDARARLVYLEVVPPQVDEGGTARPFDWNILLGAAALDSAKLTTAEPKWLPPTMADARVAWTGAWPGSPALPLRVEAAAWRGRPVYFQMIGPWTIPDRMPRADSDPAFRAPFMGILLLLVLIAGIYLAHRNLRLGRGDRRGALRLSIFVTVILLSASLLAAHHLASWYEFAVIFTALARALVHGGIVWLLYIALEPYVRRQWPQTLIGWSRVLAGAWRDPLVAGDVLIGVTWGAVSGMLACVSALLRMRAGAVWSEMNERLLDPLLGPRMTAATWLWQVQDAVTSALWVFLLIFMLRAVVRKSWIAAIACMALFTAERMLHGGGTVVPTDVLIWGTIFAGGIFVLMRFGMLAFAAVVFASVILWISPVDLSGWYMASSLCALLSVLALAAFAFHTTLAGRPVIKDDFFS
jgi:serine/threonine-protein kinase